MVLGETFKEVGAAGVAGWSCRRGWVGGGDGAAGVAGVKEGWGLRHG